ncbi:integrase family protein [Acinetobacter ursingii]|uniref:tyrosine-type recombinase/integrase n=1 Tax=Acinetobacter ursingii TaxID=108980 RepID=UPI00249C52C8|nr:integrase family protein [Acinetobacter ursingii]MDI3237499.1 integrase family protein [Acinetobacter ursingii]
MSAKKYNLTKTFIDSLPFCSDKQVFYKDEKLQGFAVRVTKNSKSYIVEKKLPTGETCRVTIGQHGVWTISQAREKAQEYLLMIAKGINPNLDKRTNKNQYAEQKENSRLIPTLQDAYTTYKLKKKLSENTLDSYNRCINDYFEDWKNLKITSITNKMILDRHTVLSERSKAQANLAMKFFSALYNLTSKIVLDSNSKKIITEPNPVGSIYETKTWNKIKRRRNYIRADQLHDWAYHVATTHWLGSQKNNMHAYTNQDYLFLIILTGFRRSEAETVEWKNIDLKYGTIKITDTKNGEDLLLPLGDMLWHILKERKKRAGDNQYIFPDRTGKSHIEDRRDIRRKITESSGIEFTFHDLRRTFGTIANSLAIGSYTIKRLINHTLEDDDNDVTDGYIQVSFEDLRKAMNMIEDKVLSDEVKQLITNRQYK